MPILITEHNFDSEVGQSKLPALVKFGAPWCAPCKALEPIINELAKEFEGQIKMCQVDIDTHPHIASTWGVMNLPTILFFKNGRPENQCVGMVSKTSIIKKIKALI